MIVSDLEIAIASPSFTSLFGGVPVKKHPVNQTVVASLFRAALWSAGGKSCGIVGQGLFQRFECYNV